MVNLKEIEKAIDELLASETDASLDSWLKEQNISFPQESLREGDCVPFELQSQRLAMVTTTTSQGDLGTIAVKGK